MKTIFIDRDGVINKDPGGWTEYSYVTKWVDFHFLPGVFAALKLLNRNRVKVVIISNQAGVSKGYFTKERLKEINSRMLDEINKNGGRIEEVYYCVHRKEDECACRKPKTGMLEDAIKKYNVTPSETFMIGDSIVDVIAGRRVGARTIFVLSGKSSPEEMRKWEEKPDYVFKDLLEAVEWLIKKKRRREDRKFKRIKADEKAAQQEEEEEQGE